MFGVSRNWFIKTRIPGQRAFGMAKATNKVDPLDNAGLNGAVSSLTKGLRFTQDATLLISNTGLRGGPEGLVWSRTGCKPGRMCYMWVILTCPYVADPSPETFLYLPPSRPPCYVHVLNTRILLCFLQNILLWEVGSAFLAHCKRKTADKFIEII